MGCLVIDTLFVYRLFYDETSAHKDHLGVKFNPFWIEKHDF